MSHIAIKVEELGKLYRLGEIGTGTISHDLNRWWARMRGKEDPFAKIGEANDRTAKGASDYVWALKDVSFEVAQGEVLGIIGRNGAGKSTLLKILSKVTTPSAGRIKIKGRIASLLEVGTGFHPELTGRENIFLNGAILGMTKAEIRSKFDEIVDFAGVERYIDTPVKRYSSGMYVRLAFAVAAFLEPEILIVDEVLAVGDAEFQKKCLGRMQDVSRNDGRTVLFVSHNMAALEALCNRAIIIKNGSLVYSGMVNEAISSYNKQNRTLIQTDLSNRVDRTGNGNVIFTKLDIESVAKTGSQFKIKVVLQAKDDFRNASCALTFKDENNKVITNLYTRQSNELLTLYKGFNYLTFIVNNFPFNEGSVFLDAWVSSTGDDTSDYLKDAFELNVSQGDFFGNGFLPKPTLHGFINIKNEWDVRAEKTAC